MIDKAVTTGWVVSLTPFSFDTLGASKQLREAGMPEGMAEAVVSVFRHVATTPDVSHLATKDDIADMATKAYVDLVKSDLRTEILASGARVRETIRLQGWALTGGMGIMLAVFGSVAGFLA